MLPAMTTTLITLIAALTCSFAFTIYVMWTLLAEEKEARQTAQSRLVMAYGELYESRATAETEMRASMREQAQWATKMMTGVSKSHETMLAAMDKSMALQAETLQSAVQVAWAPTPTIAGGAVVNTPYVLPTPLGANVGAVDDSDPTDGFIGRPHEESVMASDSDLVIGGNFLGIPGLVPPPGALDMMVGS